MGLTLDKAEKEVLGHASKVVLTKDTTTIVGDGSTQEAVNKRVVQIRNLIEVSIFHPLSHINKQCVWGFIFTVSRPIKLTFSCRLQSKITRRKN